jgi:hypothetical protein
LPAGHVSPPGFTQPLDALPVARIEVETVGETFVYQFWDAEAFELIVDLGLVAQRKKNLSLSGCELVAFPVDDVLKKIVGELGTLEARIIQQALRERLEGGGILSNAVDLDPRCHVAGSIELSRRDATNAVYNLWEIMGKINGFAAAYKARQASGQAATAALRVNRQVGVLQSSFPQVLHNGVSRAHRLAAATVAKEKTASAGTVCRSGWFYDSIERFLRLSFDAQRRLSEGGELDGISRHETGVV